MSHNYLVVTTLDHTNMDEHTSQTFTQQNYSREEVCGTTSWVRLTI